VSFINKRCVDQIQRQVRINNKLATVLAQAHSTFDSRRSAVDRVDKSDNASNARVEMSLLSFLNLIKR